GFSAVHRNALQAAKGEQLGRAAVLDDVAVDVHRADRIVYADRAALDAAGQDTAEERIAIEQSREHLELARHIESWRRHVADDRLEERRQVAFADAVLKPRIARAPGRIERGEIELFVIGVEIEEQLEHLVEHFRGARVGTVDLVDDDDRTKAERERLA